jgi:hypothetical protein
MAGTIYNNGDPILVMRDPFRVEMNRKHLSFAKPVKRAKGY